MKRFLIITSLLVSPLVEANQAGYCLVETGHKIEILSYFNEQDNENDSFLFQGITSAVEHGTFKSGTFEGTTSSLAHPHCKLTTYVGIKKRISAKEFTASINQVDRCGIFVFDIFFTEEARCIFLESPQIL